MHHAQLRVGKEYDRFRSAHPDVVDKLREVRQMNIKTDDVSHFLIDISSIESDCLHRNRSFLHPELYHGWKDYHEIISAYGVYTEEGENMRKFW